MILVTKMSFKGPRTPSGPGGKSSFHQKQKGLDYGHIQKKRGGQQQLTYSQAGSSGPPRSYAQAASSASSISNADKEAYQAIAKDAGSQRNTLILSTPKPSDPAIRAGRQLLTHDQWATLIFGTFNLQVKDVEGIDFHAGGINAVELKFNEKFDTSPLINSSADFDGRSFTLSKQEMGSTKVTFKNVPFSVPDAELLHLVKSYGGKMENNQVEHEKVSVKLPDGEIKYFEGTTRSIHASFPPNKRLRTFYWLQGPLPKDPMRRVLVEHTGQVGKQCSFCLKSSADPIDPCMFNGRSAACKEHNSKGKCSLSRYFIMLRDRDGYSSLKHTYMWGEQEETLSQLKYSDDYQEEKEKDEGEKEKAPSALVSSPSSDWAQSDSLDALQVKLSVAEDKIAKKDSTIANLKRDLKALSDEAAANSSKAIQLVVAKLKDPTDFMADIDSISSTFANSLPLDKFVLQKGEKEVAEEKEGFDYTADLMKEVNARITAVDDQCIDSLKNLTKQKVLGRLLNVSNHPRSRSQSRGRSVDDDHLPEKPTKNAKTDTSVSPPPSPGDNLVAPGN